MEDAVERARDKGPIAAIFIETPANPTNGLVDIFRARQLAESLSGPDGKRPMVIVDNTLLGPLFQTPIAHGADLAVTSLTKYVGGHSDLIAGRLLGSGRRARPDPRHAHDPRHDVRSLDRLAADALARDPQAQNDCRGRGRAQGGSFWPAIRRSPRSGISAFCRRTIPIGRCSSASARAPDRLQFRGQGGEAEAFAALDKLEVIKLAVSLGGTETPRPRIPRP